MNKDIEIRKFFKPDEELIRSFLIERWGAEWVVVHGDTYQLLELPAFAAYFQGQLAGFISYNFIDKSCEIVSIDSYIEHRGIGTALFNAVVDAARKNGCQTIWLVTTNDNIEAAVFYQKRGMRLTRINFDEVEKSRRKKPSIPEFGNHGIPIRDEWVFEIDL